MHPTTLYIIGNGFDLWHGISSGLRDFKAYVLATAPDIHREVEDYLPAGEDWCDLELALAALDADMLVDNLGHFMVSYGDTDWSDSAHGDFQYEVENVIERLSTGLRERFGEWIRTLYVPTADTVIHKLPQLDPQALFLTFNYTSTLSRLYGIELARVLHIHGRADKAGEELVIGHAWNPQSRRSLNDRQGIEDIDTRLAQVNDMIDDYFSATFKRSEELIVQHSAFFEGLGSIERVVVLGHSLSTVDMAYFRALLRQPSVAASRWVVACRRADEWPTKEARLIEIGLRPGAAICASWETLE